MYRYFYDWEFQEQQDPKTGLTTIFPISIGMVDEEGRELYLINNTYWYWEDQGLVKTSDWVKKNVLNYITDADRSQYGYNFKRFGMFIKHFVSRGKKVTDRRDVELWAYFADYDHVALAQCFGSMMQLPDCIPMFTHDIKQLVGNRTIGFGPEDQHHALSDARWNKKVWETFA